MKFIPAADNTREGLFAIITVLFLLVLPHLAGKQGFIAAMLLVAAYTTLFRGNRMLTLFLTATAIVVATVGIVFLVAR